jgi:5-methylcytosine-specific restriction endonuclease McrA
MTAHSSAYRNARKKVLAEATRCFHCGREISALLPVGHPLKATADHLFPQVRGGPHTVENLVPCCAECNSRKGAKDVNWRTSTVPDDLAKDW